MKCVHGLYAGTLAIVLGLGGCATTGGGEDGTGTGEAVGAGTETYGEVTALPPGSSLTLDSLNDPESPLAKRIVYFSYDSSEVDSEYLEVIAAHGRFLAKYPQQRLRLEGHTDERGSREYNLALGEQRARSVLELLRLEGASAEQVEVVSYGEELPAAFGHDDASWQLNRRVELVYQE